MNEMSVQNKAQPSREKISSKSWLFRTHMSLIMLILVTSATLIRFDRPLARGDSIAYLAWIDTLIRDRDVDFTNQLSRFATVNTYQISWNAKTEQYVNIFPFGIAFLQAPFYILGDISVQNNWFNYNPDYFHQMQGVELPYTLWMMFGTNIMTLVAIVFCWDMGRRYCGAWLSAFVVYLVFINTPMLFYSAITPLNPHSAAAFTLTVTMWILLTRHNHRIGWQVLLGVFAGLTVLTRWQLVISVVPIWGYLLVSRQFRFSLISMLSFGLTLLPIPIIWQTLYGSPFVIPYNETSGQSFLTASNEFLRVLWRTVVISPVILLCIPGAYWGWRKYKLLTITMGIMIILQLFINGAALDWNAGYSYGMRRMTELLPVYAIFACIAFGAVEKSFQASRRVFMNRLLYLVPTLGIIYTFVYLLSLLSFVWTHPESWLGDLSPDNVISYFINQPDNIDVVNVIFTTHLGPPAWKMPGP